MTLPPIFAPPPSTTPPSLLRRPSPAAPAPIPNVWPGPRSRSAGRCSSTPSGWSRPWPREPVDRAEQRVALLPPLLWARSGKAQARYLELMEQHGWLHLAAIRADGGPVTG